MNRRIDFDSAKASLPLDSQATKDFSGPTHRLNDPKRRRPNKPRYDYLQQYILGNSLIGIGWHRQPDDAHLAGIILQLIGEAELKGILDENPKD